MRGRERLAEPGRHLAEPRALGAELLESSLELVRHRVERPAEARELVAALDRDADAALAAGDRVRRVDEAGDAADDRTADQVRDERDQEQRAEQADDQPALGGPREASISAFGARTASVAPSGERQRLGLERPVPVLPHAQGACPLGLEPRAEHLPRPADDPAGGGDDDERGRASRARSGCEGWRRAPRRAGPRRRPGRARRLGADHRDLALGGERRLPADGEAASDDAHVRGRPDRAPERGAVLALERDLDGAAPREPVRPLRRDA